MLSRRNLLLALAALPGAARAAPPDFPAVVPRPLRFPRDFGAHPEFRLEWWYLTGWLGPGRLGFQVTFFRVRTNIDAANPSAFAAHELIIAHAALADPARGHLLVDERIARTGFGRAGAATGDTDVRLDDWRLRRDAGTGRYEATINARDFHLAFTASSAAPPWPQGDAGVSRKGPLPAQASYYYSQPQLAVAARLRVSAGGADAPARQLAGTAWLDHEWSSAALSPDAAGWDWIGMNLADGGALVAFQVRPMRPGEPLARFAATRTGAGVVQVADPTTVVFTPVDDWTSARTGARWPIAQRIRIGAREFTTQPLMADQELDSRATAGAIYWEGASTLTEGGRTIGRGYLEMTGYLKPIHL